MFHQVFICKSPQGVDDSLMVPEGLTLGLEENNVNPNITQIIPKQENQVPCSEETKMGFIQPEEIKMAIDEARTENVTVINNLITMKTDTDIKLDLETQNSFNVIPSYDNTISPESQGGQTFLQAVPAPVIDPLQTIITSSSGQMIVQQPQPAVINSFGSPCVFRTAPGGNLMLQPQPTLLNMNGNAVQLVPLQTGVGNVSLIQQPAQNIPNLTMKNEAITSVNCVAEKGTSVTEIKSEDIDDVEIKTEEEPMDLYSEPGESEDVKAQKVDIKPQKINAEVGGLVCRKLKLAVKKEEPTLTDTKPIIPKALSSAELNKNRGIKIFNTSSNEHKNMENITECTVVVNNSPLEYITPEVIPENDEVNLEGPPSEQNNQDHSESDVEEDRAYADDNSGSDWELEYLSKREKQKIQNKKKKITRLVEKITRLVEHVKDNRPAGGVANTQHSNIKNKSKKSNNPSKKGCVSKILNVGTSSTVIPRVILPSTNNSKGSSNNFATTNKVCVPNSNNKSILLQNTATNYILAKPNNGLIHLNAGNTISQIQVPVQSTVQNNMFCFVSMDNRQLFGLQNNLNTNFQNKKLILTGPIDLPRDKAKEGKNTKLQTLGESSQNANKSPSDDTNITSQMNNRLNFKKILPKPASSSYEVGVVKVPTPKKVSSEESVHNNTINAAGSSTGEKSESLQYLFRCKECPNVFATLDLYVNHKKASMCFKKTEYVRPQCDICKKHFATSASLKVHKFTHSSDKPFKCPQCDERFGSSNAKFRHIKTKHKGFKGFMCSFCGRYYAEKKYLKAHEELHRLDEGAEPPKPYQCTECGKCFRFSTTLKGHMKYHSPASYFCAICDKGFKSRANLLQHMITHSESRPISCHLCGEKFKRMTHLKQHQSAAHS